MQDEVYEQYSMMLFHDLEMIVEHGLAWDRYLLSSDDFDIFLKSSNYEFLSQVVMHPLVPVTFLEKVFVSFPNFEPGLITTMLENKRFTVESLLLIIRRAENIIWYQLIRFDLFPDDEIYKDIVWRAANIYFRKIIVYRYSNFLSPWMIVEAYIQYGHDDTSFVSEAFSRKFTVEGEIAMRKLLLDYCGSVLGNRNNWESLPKMWLVELLLPFIKVPYTVADIVL